MNPDGITQAFITGSAGLVGVVIGGVITVWKERRAERSKREKDLAYLVVLVSSSLRELAESCLAAAYDDGTSEGRPAGDDGVYEAVVPSPVFKPRELDVEWKELPIELMEEILCLPTRMGDLRSEVSAYWDAEGPPYDGGFEVRQLGFARLGVQVCETVAKLRAVGKLRPEGREASTSSLRTRMEARLEHLEARRLAIKAKEESMPAFAVPLTPMVSADGAGVR